MKYWPIYKDFVFEVSREQVQSPHTLRGRVEEMRKQDCCSCRGGAAAGVPCLVQVYKKTPRWFTRLSQSPVQGPTLDSDSRRPVLGH